MELWEECTIRLKPWKEGPLDLFGIIIGTEWRSDLKGKVEYNPKLSIYLKTSFYLLLSINLLYNILIIRQTCDRFRPQFACLSKIQNFPKI